MRMTRSLGLGALMTTVALGAAVACSSSDENPQNPPSNQADAGTEMDGEADADLPDGDTDGEAPDGGDPIVEDLWIKAFENADPQSLVVVPATGEIVVGGTFSGEVDFGKGSHTAEPDKTAGFLAKFDKDGNAVFSKHWDGVRAVRVGVDSSGDIYVAGRFADTIDLGGDDLTSAGSDDIFLARFTNDGAHVFSKRLGGDKSDELTAFDVSASGKLSITGSFRGTVDFGGGAFTSEGMSDVFVAQFDADGGHVFSNRLSADASEDAGSVASAANGDLFIGFAFNGTFVCDGKDHVASPYARGVMALDGSGKCKWFEEVGAGSAQIAIDSNGDILVGAGDTLAKLGVDGSPKWDTTIFSGSGTRGTAPFRVGDASHPALCGTYDGDLVFDDETIPASGLSAFFLAFDGDGKLVARRVAPGASQASCKALAPSLTTGTYVVTGKFDGEVDLGHDLVNGKGMYLGKMKLTP